MRRVPVFAEHVAEHLADLSQRDLPARGLQHGVHDIRITFAGATHERQPILRAARISAGAHGRAAPGSGGAARAFPARILSARGWLVVLERRIFALPSPRGGVAPPPGALAA